MRIDARRLAGHALRLLAGSFAVPRGTKVVA
jgi:hypothetical protein